MKKISKESRDKLLNALAEQLDTRDKRYMFIRVSFGSKFLSQIQLEGTPANTAWNIYDEFEKQGMIGSLMACMNNCFELDLLLELVD